MMEMEEEYQRLLDSGAVGVLIAIKDVLKGIMVEESNSKRKEESIWLSLTNNKTKIRIGILYNPQASHAECNIDNCHKMHTRQNIQHLHDETLIVPIHEHLQLHASQYKQKT